MHRGAPILFGSLAGLAAMAIAVLAAPEVIRPVPDTTIGPETRRVMVRTGRGPIIPVEIRFSARMEDRSAFDRLQPWQVRAVRRVELAGRIPASVGAAELNEAIVPLFDEHPPGEGLMAQVAVPQFEPGATIDGAVETVAQVSWPGAAAHAGLLLGVGVLTGVVLGGAIGVARRQRIARDVPVAVED